MALSRIKPGVGSGHPAVTPERWSDIQRQLDVALSLNIAERSAFLESIGAKDIELRNELESLLAGEAADPGFMSTGALSLLQSSSLESGSASNSLLGKILGAYRITGQIGVGGMGEVYLAARADGHYDQEVAVKIVRPGLGGHFGSIRFRNERQILANLDHPNIAKILDGGTTEDGLPYFVMEFIDGSSITEYCDQNCLSIEERFQLFRTVCSAVHYAHQHLIVHRDIKPTNILVTPEGTPKLLDFGIAKMLSSDLPTENATLTGVWTMTPEYASPEQFRGEPITTATDVYSLGLILYELLTGQRAHRFSSRLPHEMARVVLESDPAKPSSAVFQKKIEEEKTAGQDNLHNLGSGPILSAACDLRGFSTARKLHRRLTGDADNIVLKALRKEPGGRYASADQLSEDIRRHLERRPINASKGTTAYRFRKYVLRHKAGVASASFIFLILVTGIVVTLHEARIAQRRFNDVRALANSLIFDVHDSIQDLPGATPARKLIVEKGLQYLDGLARESQGDPDLQRELAAAYKRIGDVQGYEFNSNLGDPVAALGSYQKALAIRKTLYSRPGGIMDAKELAEAYRLVSQTLEATNDLSGALGNAQEAVRIAEPLASSHLDDASALLELIVAYQAVANVLGGPSLCNLGDQATATIYRHKQLQTAEQLAKLIPADDRGQGNLAIALNGFADQLLYGGERLSSLQYYSQARSIFANLADHSRKRLRAIYLMDEVSEAIALVELSNGELARALMTARDTAKSEKKLSAADPRDVQSGMALANYYELLADLESRAGNAQKASINIHEASALINRFASANPKDTESTASLAALQVVAGNVASRSDNVHAALNPYAAAIVLVQRLQADNPGNMAAAVRLAEIYNRIGDVQIRLHDFKAATAAFDHAVALVDVDAASAKANAEALYSIANSNFGLGEVQAALAKNTGQENNHRIEYWRQAVSWYERSLSASAKIKEPAMITPDGFDAVLPSVATQRLTSARVALGKLTKPVIK
jgi:eukaryotic-like serine/threonine-protein kinase